MEFLSPSRRRSSARNFPSGKERGETDVFVGYFFLSLRGRRLKRKGKAVGGAPRVSLAPKTPFSFPFKRLPRKLLPPSLPDISLVTWDLGPLSQHHIIKDILPMRIFPYLSDRREIKEQTWNMCGAKGYDFFSRFGYQFWPFWPDGLCTPVLNWVRFLEEATSSSLGDKIISL